MTLLIAFSILLVGWALWEYRRQMSAADFHVAGRSRGAASVAVSIVASCVGGSATIGMAGLAWQVGTPAFWWLGSGACGLLVLALFLARKVRRTGVHTMPELAERFMGGQARLLVALVIVVAWVAILAAQFTAMANIIAALAGIPLSAALLAGAVLVTAYTILGGQATVMRSDVVQYAVTMGGLAIALAWVLKASPVVAPLRLELLNDGFAFDRWTYYMVVLGGSYVVCPMLFGRLLSARNELAAVRGALFGVAGLLASAALIVALGIYARGVVPADTAPDALLTAAIASAAPAWLGGVLLLALLSAIVSSADSCLITAAGVFSNDLLRSRDVRTCRRMALLLGACALVVATWGKGVLGLLLAANDVYVCGVVCPVFVAMLADGKFAVDRRLIVASIVAGGLLGLAAALSDAKAFSYAGVGVSFALALLSLRRQPFRQNSPAQAAL